MIRSNISCNVQDTLKSLDQQEINKMLYIDVFGLLTVTNKAKIQIDGHISYIDIDIETILSSLQLYSEAFYNLENCQMFNLNHFDIILSPIREFKQYKVFAFCLRFDKKGYSTKDIITFKFIFNSKYREILLDYEFENEHYRLEKIFDTVASFIFILNGDYEIISANRKSYELFAEDSRKLISQNIFDIIPDLNTRKFHTLSKNAKLKKTNYYLSDEVILTEKGKIFLDLTISPYLITDEETIGIMLIGGDKTKQKIYELEIDQLNQFSLLGELAAGLAHDIKNPLTSIRGCTRILEKKLQSDSECLSFLSPIISEVDRINAVINQMLSYTFITQKDNYSFININEVLEKSLNVSKFHIKLKKIVITQSLAPQLPMIKANNVQLQQAFFNIIFNAVQAIESEGHITISSRQEAITQRIIVTIEDNGHGIPKDQIEYIFDPLFTTKEYGHGVGLSIAKRALDKLSAEIGVTSIENKGTLFKIAIPY
jgi:PAS domain S-box-containing protein